MSTKDFSKPDQTRDCYFEWRDCSNAITSNGHYDLVVKRHKGMKTGNNTFDFHEKVKSGGLLPPQWYHRWDYRMDLEPGVLDARYPCAGAGGDAYDEGPGICRAPTVLWDGSGPLLPNDFLPWGNVNTNALLLAAMADILPDLDALTTAVEARKTLSMVRKAHSDAKRLIRTALKGGKHTVKAASEAWLAWRYGWRQLGFDCQNIASLLENPFQSYVVSGQSGESLDYTNSTTTDDSSWLFDSSSTTTWTGDQSVRARVLGVWNGHTLRAIADPAITWWEATAFSFVADWFVNIGDLLAAWKVLCNLERLHCSLGYYYTLKASSVRSGTLKSPYLGEGFESLRDETYVAKCRVPASSPTFVPSFNVNLTTSRCLDLAALLSKRIF